MVTISLLPSYRVSSSSSVLFASSEHCLLPTQAAFPAHKKRLNFHSSSPASLASTHHPFLTNSPSFYRLNLSSIRHQKSHYLSSRQHICSIFLSFSPRPSAQLPECRSPAPCLPPYASKPPSLINTARTLIIIRSRHLAPKLIHCSHHRSST